MPELICWNWMVSVRNVSLVVRVPDPLKKAGVGPLLKNPPLDSTDLNNFRPESNVPFLGKVVEHNSRIYWRKLMIWHYFGLVSDLAWDRNCLDGWRQENAAQGEHIPFRPFRSPSSFWNYRLTMLPTGPTLKNGCISCTVLSEIVTGPSWTESVQGITVQHLGLCHMESYRAPFSPQC